MSKPPTKMPATGSVFALPMFNGMYSSCWVLKSAVKDDVLQVLVLSTDFYSVLVPTGITDEMTQLDMMEDWEDELIWIDEPAPKEFKLLGLVKPKANNVDSDSFSGWEYLPFQATHAWRSEHDSEALLAEETAKGKVTQEKAQAVAEKIEADLKSMTLEKLIKYRFFQDWSAFPSRKIKTAARKLLKKLATDLMELGDRPAKRNKLAAIKTCVEGFNDLVQQDEELYDTGIREDIIDQLMLFDSSTRIKDLEKHIDLWRDF